MTGPGDTGPIRVLIVDDHPVVRSGLRALLAGVDDIEPVGEAADGIAALAAVRDVRPDVVLMDLAMPGLSGVEVTRRLTTRPATADVAGVSTSTSLAPSIPTRTSCHRSPSRA